MVRGPIYCSGLFLFLEILSIIVIVALALGIGFVGHYSFSISLVYCRLDTIVAKRGGCIRAENFVEFHDGTETVRFIARG